jgi:hypothetical protein
MARCTPKQRNIQVCDRCPDVWHFAGLRPSAEIDLAAADFNPTKLGRLWHLDPNLRSSRVVAALADSGPQLGRCPLPAGDA